MNISARSAGKSLKFFKASKMNNWKSATIVPGRSPNLYQTAHFSLKERVGILLTMAEKIVLQQVAVPRGVKKNQMSQRPRILQHQQKKNRQNHQKLMIKLGSFHIELRSFITVSLLTLIRVSRLVIAPLFNSFSSFLFNES